MIEEEKKAIENLGGAIGRRDCTDLYWKDADIIYDLIQKQDTEINKLNNVIKWKPIEKYDRQKYDWVLVKYFDGDYECVPEVAEQRSDGKWYTSEKQIPFEVKYFFDMQILDEERRG